MTPDPSTVSVEARPSRRKTLLLPDTLMLSAPTVALASIVTVAPLLTVITQLSVLEGAPAGLQFAAVPNTVPAPPAPAPIQVRVVSAEAGPATAATAMNAAIPHATHGACAAPAGCRAPNGSSWPRPGTES